MRLRIPATLYLQWATALLKVDPALKLREPCL